MAVRGIVADAVSSASLSSVVSRISLVSLISAVSLVQTASAASAAPAAPAPSFQLVESWPMETSLDHPDIPDACVVWKEMIDGAKASIDLAEFYVSDSTGSRLTPILAAIEAAAARGVKVRLLAEKKFHRTYPENLDRLGTRPGIEVRLYDVAALMGGVLYAKYFIVDGAVAYLGSQNFDWRSLMHIQELGVQVREPRTVGVFRDVFEADWALAGGKGAKPTGASDAHRDFPVAIASAGDTVRVTPVCSPRGWLPDDSLWDLPRLVGLIDSARTAVRVQLLTYRSTDREGRFFDELEAALRGAAARGVSVQLLFSDWCQRAGTIEGLQSLEPLSGLEVRLVTIPPWSGGFVPYARVIHAKYLVVDGRRAWIGTSNWERDYFFASRNVGLILESKSLGATLDRFFLDGWNGPYAKPVDPCGKYQPPRIGE